MYITGPVFTIQTFTMSDEKKRLESSKVGFSLILLIHKVVYISIKDLHAGYVRNSLEKFAVKFAPKN